VAAMTKAPDSTSLRTVREAGALTRSVRVP
jgi:hypothetical protein